MRILSCYKCATAITIDKYMTMELPISRVEGKSWLKDSVTVTLVDSQNLMLYAVVSRTEMGYHWGVRYETPTDGGINSAYNYTPPVSKLSALREVMINSLKDYYITRHSGNQSNIERALADLRQYEYQQLTLF